MMQCFCDVCGKPAYEGSATVMYDATARKRAHPYSRIRNRVYARLVFSYSSALNADAMDDAPDLCLDCCRMAAQELVQQLRAPDGSDT